MVLALIISIGVPALISVGVALFAKYFPKEQTYTTKIKPLFIRAASVVFLFGSRWLKPIDFDKVEEGPIKTICFWGSNGVNDFSVELDRLIEVSKTEQAKKK